MLQPNGEIWRFFKRKRKKKRRNLATRKPKKKKNKIIAILEKKEEAKLAKFNKEKNTGYTQIGVASLQSFIIMSLTK
jgi:hypothetical protein